MPRAFITPGELLEMPDVVNYELVNGYLVERNVSGLSSLVALEVGRRLGNHLESIGSPGWVFGADMGYQCFADRPSKVRKPDVSYVPRDRVSLVELESGFLRVPPALAVEVVSPNDLAEDLQLKLKEYLTAGVQLVWIIDPVARTARVVGLDGSNADLGEDETLSGRDVLPGFACRVGDMLPAEAPPAA
jgi:Uma2 family endonuclease